MVTTLESLKKAFLIGLGATVMTAEKVKELIDDLEARGELSQQDAKSFSEDLRTRAIEEKERFEARVRDSVETQVKKVMDHLGLVTRAEFDALREELNQQKQSSAE